MSTESTEPPKDPFVNVGQVNVALAPNEENREETGSDRREDNNIEVSDAESLINEPTDDQLNNDFVNEEKLNNVGKFIHNDILLYSVRHLQASSALITLVLSILSISFFYKTDERMGLILFFSVISLVYHLAIYITIKFIKTSRVVNFQRYLMCVFLLEFSQCTMWFIGFLLIVIRYPFYNCGRQGSGYRINGCRCGQGSLAFILLNFVLYVFSFVVLTLNIKYDQINQLKFKHHLLDFEHREEDGESGYV